MLAESSITDPWNKTYEFSSETIANLPQSILVHQTDNYINGSYQANVSWFELGNKDSVQKDSSSVSFEIVDAGTWCAPSLKFDFDWAINGDTETWNFVEISSHNYDFEYYEICESPLFTVNFDDDAQEYKLAQPIVPKDRDEYDHTFKIDMPATRQYKANLSITTHALNGA